jgi:hypothetical protein
MAGGAADDTNALLNCFFETCESRFRFLEQEYGYRYISGLAQVKAGRQIVVPYKGQNANIPFWAVTRYEQNEETLEITYGDSNFMLEGYLHDGQINRVSFAEILLAAHKGADAINGRAHVQTIKEISNLVTDMAGMIKTHRKYFLETRPKITERALAMRGKKLEQNIFEQYKADMAHASMDAARAFTAKDFKTVIALLTPYEKHLSAADAKKLEKARKSFLENA